MIQAAIACPYSPVSATPDPVTACRESAARVWPGPAVRRWPGPAVRRWLLLCVGGRRLLGVRGQRLLRMPGRSVLSGGGRRLLGVDGRRLLCVHPPNLPTFRIASETKSSWCGQVPAGAQPWGHPAHRLRAREQFQLITTTERVLTTESVRTIRHSRCRAVGPGPGPGQVRSRSRSRSRSRPGQGRWDTTGPGRGPSRSAGR